VNFRKEDRVRARLRERGTHPGLICIFSALERCCTYQPWHDKKTGKTFLRPHDGKCLHYYFYFLDEDLGLVFVRVPTWCPFRLQIYFNGHEWLASQLRRQGISLSVPRHSLYRDRRLDPRATIARCVEYESTARTTPKSLSAGSAVQRPQVFN